MKTCSPHRSPKDCLQAPISIRLSATEIATIQELADSIGRSRASFIRRLIERGMEAYQLDPRLTVLDEIHLKGWLANSEEAKA
ncbi:ribbon-helix-helix protein, CopG family [Glaciimonas soli]|uniref:Ribbon-helix-helix protein, CopG family n=1 Tax=Glaciimonas soli TaxID=2590999 RepID=A0A843YVW9_9BURK|nr:ribbon-helix-helix protein, CopG family [Glaciimonas soli]MQR01441.1 ribbon-helix-helix protein, CopG family [Glaciimonas soli]